MKITLETSFHFINLLRAEVHDGVTFWVRMYRWDGRGLVGVYAYGRHHL